MAGADEMRTEHQGTTLERLDRIESKLDTFISEHGRTHDAERDLRERLEAQITGQVDDVRSLQDWRIEVAIYLRQAKWAVALAGGAFLVGIVNAILQLAAIR